MTKLKIPLLSFGAQGTIANALTFQKRARGHFARQKPIPKDPKSPAQLAQRQIYRDAVDAWHALSPAEKEAWRGVCPGLTAYQCFMSSELKYVPPTIPIDIGGLAIDRVGRGGAQYTIINATNPANAGGIITSIEVWANTDLEGFEVATFYVVDTNTFTTRDHYTIGNVAAGSKQTFSGLSIAVAAGDYLGHYVAFSIPAGYIELDSEGYSGYWYKANDFIPCADVLFGFINSRCFSVHGIG